MTHAYRFGAVEVRPAARQVLVDGAPTTIGARAFDLLMALLERRDRIVPKHELMDIVWPGLVVEEGNLQVQIFALRKLLGPRSLSTVPGRGYQFTMPLDGDGVRERVSPVDEFQPRRTNLPASSDALIGREADIAAIKELLADHRLVTISGAGGIGKTRLAQEVARELPDQFHDGIWWVDLATVASREMIAPAIAAAANLKLGAFDPTAELARAIGVRRMLLVLDNCEYLAADVATVARSVLGACPEMRILVTSQELLRIPGEYVYPLDSLAVPPAGDSLSAALQFSALQLLERRTRAADPRFSLSEANVTHAIELCRRLDGMALAIEMAAARIPLLGLEALLGRLGERLRLLHSADRDAAPRYRTMRATLEWSHSLLSSQQQAVLRRLSIFVGSFRLDMAQAVCAEGDLDEWEVLECLSALVDKSLLKVERAEPPRYRLLETTRLYGLELLVEAGETEALIRRHARAMAALNDEVMQAFDEQPELVCLRRYLADYDDLQAAFDRAYERQDIDLAASNVMALSRFDLARGFYFAMRRRKAAAYSMVAGADLAARARLWYCIVIGRYMACPGVNKITAAREEVAAWKGIGERKRLYDALGRLASNLGTAGDFAAAEGILAEAQALEEADWPPQHRAMFCFNATIVAAYGNDLPLFKARIDTQMAWADKARFKRLAAVSRMQMAEWALSAGRVQEALQLGPIAISEMRALENPFGLSNSLATYCDGLLMAGELARVSPLLHECVPIALRNGVAGWAFDPLALYAVRVRQAEMAAKALGFADARYAEIDEVRRPWDKRTAGLAGTEIDAVLGEREHLRLRALGAALNPAQAEALAAEVLSVSQPVGQLN